MSLFSTESEYFQLAKTAAEISWLCMLFKNLCIFLKSPPLLWCDNISSIYLASNPMFHARIKHLEVHYHYVREKVVSNALYVCYINTVDQVANIFTKGLTMTHFQLL